MRANIYDFLPEKISDESAYNLVSFFMSQYGMGKHPRL
jgi:hypothetical protein